MEFKLDRSSRQKLKPFQKRGIGRLCSFAIASLSFASVLSGGVTPASAAERLTLRLGPFEQSVNIEDLEDFANTGKLSAALKPYAPLLTPQVQQLLTKRLQVDPGLADKFIDNLLRSPSGDQLIKKIGAAIPNSTVEELKATFALAVRQTQGLSAMSFLRAYPGESLTVDASSALAIALQVNTPYLQSQALSPLLDRDLTVANTTFNSSLDPSVPGNASVSQQTLTFRDQVRHRTIPVDIYWSGTQQNPSNPLVVFSHGFGSDRRSFTYLARHLASHGFTVVSLEHPGSNAAWLTGATVVKDPSDLIAGAEYLERPKDISFLLDQLAALNQQPGQLQGKFNTQQVSVLGHSLGGYTALAVAGAEINLDELRQFCQQRNPLARAGGDWLQCAAATLPGGRVQLRDPRVVQAIAFNPLVGNLFGKDGMRQVKIPTLILTSTGDSLTPTVSHQLRPFNQLGGTKYLLTAIDATHLSVSDPDSVNPQLVKSTLVPEVLGQKAEPVRKLVRGVTLAFLKQQTPEAKTYEPFLTAGYAQSLSSSAIALHLNQQLPPSITALLESP